MIKIIFASAIAAFFTGSPATGGSGNGKNAKTENAQFKIGGDLYEIKAVISEVSDPYTFQDLRVNYSVFRNSKFLARGVSRLVGQW